MSVRLKKKAKKPKTPQTLAQRREAIRKRYAVPTVVYEADQDKVPRVATRFSVLNAYLGGGLREGGIVEVYGLEDSGKSSWAVAVAADIQKAAPPKKRHVVIVNFERVFDWDWTRQLGLDTSDAVFTLLEPKSLEEGVGDLIDLCESGEVCCAVIDSVYAAESRRTRAALKLWSDPDKGGKGGMAVEAGQWGSAWTGLKGLFKDYGIIAIAVNQAREDMAVGGPPKKGFYPPKLLSTRGRALKFYAWVRLELSAVNFAPGEHEGADGRRVRIRIIKNKTSKNPRGRFELTLIRGEGFDLIEDLVEAGLQAGVIVGRGGGSFTLGEKTFRGRASLVDTLRKQTALREKIEEHIAKKLSEKLSTAVEPSDEDETEGDD